MEVLSRWAQGLIGAWQAPHWNRERRVAYQDARLRSLVRYAFDRVPFYRELFGQHGVRPEQIRGLTDLQRMPIVERAHLQAEPVERLIADGFCPDRLIRRRTGGSTGEPLQILRSPAEERLLAAIRVRTLRRYGAGWRNRHTAVTFLRDSESAEPSRQPGGWLRHAGLHLFPRRQINCLLPEPEVLERLCSEPPEILSGGAATLALLANSLTAQHRRVLRPRVVISGGETMTPEARRQIATGFGVEPHDAYGSHEFNLLAWECPGHGFYHVCHESVLLEVLRDGRPARPGEEGEIVATALHSFAMPFLRYRLGDLVVRGPEYCRCGAPGPVLESILGRTIDFFPLSDGSRLHPYVLVGPLVAEARWVRRFKVVQESMHSVRLRLLPERPPEPGELEALRVRMQDLLPADVAVTIEITDDLPRGQAGKYRPYESRVAASFSARA